MGYLPPRMHPAVCASRSRYPNRFFEKDFQCLFNGTLNRSLPLLQLPSVISRAVVFHNNFNSGHTSFA